MSNLIHNIKTRKFYSNFPFKTYWVKGNKVLDIVNNLIQFNNQIWNLKN